MTIFSKLDGMLRNQEFQTCESIHANMLCSYCEGKALIENAVVVLSDLQKGESRIWTGAFADRLGIKPQPTIVDSIWENEILSLMDENSRQEKFLAELRFLNHLRQKPKCKRTHLSLAAKLQFRPQKSAGEITVLHRMHYIHTPGTDTIRFAICTYQPISLDFPGRNIVIDTLTGHWEELNSATDNLILSRREREVLRLVDQGKKSYEIAELLAISKNTVNRHRQEILAKLQAKNSMEACRTAKALHII